MAGSLQHYQYDTFVARWDDRTIEPAYVSFAADAAVGIDRITMQPYSPLAEFSLDYQDLLLVPAAQKWQMSRASQPARQGAPREMQTVPACARSVASSSATVTYSRPVPRP